MANTNLNSMLPSVHTYEEYEALKLHPKIFEPAAMEIIHSHQLPNEPLSLLDGTNIVFAHGNSRVLKIFPPVHHDQFASETLVMKHLHKKLSISTPTILYEGEMNGWPYVMMRRLEGTPLEGLWEKLDHENKKVIICELGSLIREVHSLPTRGLEAIDSHWQQFIKQQIKYCVKQHQSTQFPDHLLQQLPQYLESAENLLPKIKNPVLLTGEYTPMNFLVKQKAGVWHINGLIDFGDCMLGLPEYDLLGPGAFLIQGDKILLRAFLIAYGYPPQALTAALSHQLTLLMLLHRYSNLNIQIRAEGWKSTVKNLRDLEDLVWGF